jgi:hypothetical protein
VLVSMRENWSRDQDFLEEHHIPWLSVYLKDKGPNDPVAFAFTMSSVDKRGQITRTVPLSTFLDATGTPVGALKTTLSVDKDGVITNQAKFDKLVALLEEWAARKPEAAPAAAMGAPPG